MITDNTAIWKGYKLTDFGGTYDFPVGFQHFTTNPNIPVGWLPLLGGTYSREAYADLWAWIQEQGKYFITEAEWQEYASANNGVAQFYSDGDGSTTFRVPNMSCWFRGASNVDEVGSYLTAGLPNIEGQVQTRTQLYNNSGAFTIPITDNVQEYASGSSNGDVLGFDASVSNPIYGNSDTVQPPSVVGVWLVKAFGTVSNVGNQDVADISAGLTATEKRVASVEERVYLTESYSEGTEWYRVWSDGRIEQGGFVSPVATTTYDIAVTFLKPFSDTDYTLIGGCLSNKSTELTSQGRTAAMGYDKTATGFTVSMGASGANQGRHWYAFGK